MEIHITIQGPNKAGYFQGQVIVDDRPIANIHDYTTEQAVWQAAMEAVDALIYERKTDDAVLTQDKADDGYINEDALYEQAVHDRHVAKEDAMGVPEDKR